MPQSDLTQTRQHVAESRQHVAEQEARIAQLEHDGQDTRRARRLLASLREALEVLDERLAGDERPTGQAGPDGA